jgi:hypothetical protein
VSVLAPVLVSVVGSIAVGSVVRVVLLSPPVDSDVVSSVVVSSVVVSSVDVVVSGAAVVVAGKLVTGAGVLVDVAGDRGAGSVATDWPSCTAVPPPPAAPVTAGRLPAPPVEGSPVA